MRNGELFEIKVCYNKTHCFTFRDSYKLFPQSLDSLAKDLRPELGIKGSVDHSTVGVQNIKERKEELVNYLKQDILLLAGVMLRGQDIIFSKTGVDIVKKIKLPSLAMTIFRKEFSNDAKFPLYRKTSNVDKFIRRGYYGGPMCTSLWD